MSDEFEDLLKRWLRERGAADRSTLEALAGHIAVLPPRRRRWPSTLAAAAAVVVAIGLAAITLAPRLGTALASPQPTAALPTPPDPAAFAGDARLARCTAGIAPALDAFEMAHARDYRRYLPAMGLSPELDVDDPAFVVVYEGTQPFAVLGAAPKPGETNAPATLSPGHHDVCVLVGADPVIAQINVYGNVDITGLTIPADLIEPDASEPMTTAPSAPTPDVQPSFTPLPLPAWAGDARAALVCDGPPSTFGVDGPPGVVEGGDPDILLSRYLTEVHNFSLIFPIEDFTSLEREGEWALFGYLVNGWTRAAVVIGPNDHGTLSVVTVASCDPSEFSPLTPLGGRITIWRDAAGDVVPTTTLREEGDCYNGTQLELDGRLYVWDPNFPLYDAYDSAALEGTFDADAKLPATATDTGYRNVDRSLYLAADGKAAYIVTSDKVQRWPHVKGDVVSRIDCN